MSATAPENTLMQLLAEAEAAEKVVLPEEVRAQLTGFDVVRLRLLTFRNICTLADFASDHPDGWKIYRLKFQNPRIKLKTIASLVGCSLSNVKRWLNCEPLAGRDFWDTPLIDED